MAWFGTNHAKLGAFVRSNPIGLCRTNLDHLGPQILSRALGPLWEPQGAACAEANIGPRLGHL